ncbi:MAG: 2-phospho-L-lactate transferase [Chloroflexi bacterium]|nr:2-phospho-L-lactate transferase [Chloroflexota bacterium]
MKVVVLAGGVGGAKLADGVARILPVDDVTIVVNTGDDFEHLGLTICPDLDTVMYRLAAVANDETGWGRTGESWRTITEVGNLGGADWFKLGDLDLATHLTRTHLLKQGKTLTAVTQRLCTQLGINVTILPMSNQSAPTQIQSGETIYPFQTWFVQKQWQPPVTKVLLPEDVRATRAIIRAFETADIVLIAPSNPFVSIDPILNVYPIRELVMDLPKAVIAVSPIVGGQAVKGPAAKMMQELELTLASRTVAEYYDELIDGFVYDVQDAGTCDSLAVETCCLDTMMHNDADRIRLAQEILQFANKIISG